MLELSAHEQAQMPVEELFARASRFGNFARQARSNGTRVRRLEPGNSEHGPRWEVHYSLGGTERRFILELVQRRAPECLRFAIHSDAIEGELTLTLNAINAARSGVEARLTARPITTKARIVLQSMRLTRASLNKRFAKRIRALVARAEAEREADPDANEHRA